MNLHDMKNFTTLDVQIRQVLLKLSYLSLVNVTKEKYSKTCNARGRRDPKGVPSLFLCQESRNLSNISLTVVRLLAFQCSYRLPAGPARPAVTGPAGERLPRACGGGRRTHAIFGWAA